MLLLHGWMLFTNVQTAWFIATHCRHCSNCTCKVSAGSPAGALYDQPSCITLLHQACIKPCALQEGDQNEKTAGADEEDDKGIEAQPDEGGSREAGEEVVTLEQCLAWGGEQRQRCRLTMSVSGASCTQPARPARSSHIHLLSVLPHTATP